MHRAEVHVVLGVRRWQAGCHRSRRYRRRGLCCRGRGFLLLAARERQRAQCRWLAQARFLICSFASPRQSLFIVPTPARPAPRPPALRCRTAAPRPVPARARSASWPPTMASMAGVSVTSTTSPRLGAADMDLRPRRDGAVARLDPAPQHRPHQHDRDRRAVAWRRPRTSSRLARPLSSPLVRMSCRLARACGVRSLRPASASGGRVTGLLCLPHRGAHPGRLREGQVHQATLARDRVGILEAAGLAPCPPRPGSGRRSPAGG